MPKHVAQPTPRTTEYSTAAKLAAALSTAGFQCTDFKADSEPLKAATQGRCHYQGDELLLAQFSSTDQRDKDVANLRSLLTGLDASDRYLVVGENWLINVGQDKALTDRLAVAFGAAVVTAPGEAQPPTNNAANGLAAAKNSCGYYSQGVAPAIDRAVADNNGALLIRVQLGAPPEGGPVESNAPWFLMNAAAVNAAGYDSKYSTLTTLVYGLNQAINGINPGDMAGTVAKVAMAGRAVGQYCNSLG